MGIRRNNREGDGEDIGVNALGVERKKKMELMREEYGAGNGEIRKEPREVMGMELALMVDGEMVGDGDQWGRENDDGDEEDEAGDEG
ncbi:hypothetical protein CRG98_035959 [Punica granatum]|nr:hypothetical protein CRG98_035959 [Punica granatum]